MDVSSVRLEDRLAGEAPGGGQVEGIIGSPVAGAITSIAIAPNDPNVIYIGTTNGGVWKTTDASRTVTVDLNEFQDPLMDPGPDLGASRTTVAGGEGVIPGGTYLYRVTFVAGGTLVESAASRPITLTIVVNHKAEFNNLPLGPIGTVARI